jgi:hypothetical protein
MSEPHEDLHPRLLELMERMEAARLAGDLDLIAYKDEIVGLHSELPDEPHKVQCIVLYGMLINHGCNNIEANGGDAQALRNVAASEHKLFLIKEASGAEGMIDPDELARLTRREIEAGRMDEDDSIAQLAEAGSKVLGKGPGREPQPSLWKRMFG